MKIFNYFLLVPVIASVFGCAKVGVPTGGIKDTDPPTYIQGVPENKSVNFNAKEIICEFDEYIKLEDLNKELLISPPLKERPVIRVRDKSIRIDLNNELHPLTTYTINFGNALSDLNEGNPLPDFEYVFSTGDHLDSLAIAGKALNAFDHKPSTDGEVLVMLYENLADSAPLIEIPRYIGRASKHGLFSINNIHAGTFRVIAIRDAGGNLIYDPENDAIAFADSLLTINAETVQPLQFIRDTVKLKTTTEKTGGRAARAASLKSQVDTVRQQQGKLLNAMTVSLFYFQEETNRVFLDTKKRDSAEKLFFTFSRPPHDSVKLKPLNFTPENNWMLPEYSENRDTLTCWITDSLIAKQDTLLLTVSFTTTDSLNRLVTRSDTVTLRHQAAAERVTGGRRGAVPEVNKKVSSLALSTGVTSRSAVNLNKSLSFTAGRPLNTIVPGKIELSLLKDSIITAKQFTCTADSNNIRSFLLGSAWEEDSQYRLLLLPGAVSDIYGRVNDTVDLKFNTQKTDFYGRILVTLSGNSFPVILQVMDQKDRVIVSRHISQPGQVVFDFLAPSGYRLKAIYDVNGNGKWDTGNYLEHRQPERVFFYDRPVELRSNWDVEAAWELGD
ncbi:MAG TPA: Ig-like domain-containing protein [Bacteroidales bacterium]|nr:Ig-like domain-containing protein [Bacteroidales bacterium]